jgi:tetratricopeptide (TPR) repeat protein
LPLLAQLHHYRAMMENLAGNFEAAAAAAFEAIAVGERLGAGGFTTAAWIELVSIQEARGRWRDALAAEQIAQARLARRARPDPQAIAVLQGARSSILSNQGQAAEALPLARAELAYFAQHPDDVRNNLVAHQHLAWAHAGLNQFAAARAEFQTAVELAAALPPETLVLPILATQRVWIEIMARDGQALLDAVAHARSFPENAEDTTLPWAAPYARVLLGQAAAARDEALAAVEALAPLGATDGDLQHAWYVLGLVERALGHTADAAGWFERARDGLRAVPSGPPSTS